MKQQKEINPAIKEEFEALMKEAGFKNISDFAKNTISPISGKARTPSGISQHLSKKVPLNILVLEGYAKDLETTFENILQVFRIKPKFDLKGFLRMLGFKEENLGSDNISFTGTFKDFFYKIILPSDNYRDKRTITIVYDRSTVAGDEEGEIIFAVPFVPSSERMFIELLGTDASIVVHSTLEEFCPDPFDPSAKEADSIPDL